MRSISREEEALNYELLHQPRAFEYRYNHAAACRLRQTLFRSLARQRDDYLCLFFPQGPPRDQSEPWSLRTAQGAIEGAEYTAAAKGTACGHIFKSGESTYHCKACAADDTCVLCARCFESSDHEDHMVFISVSPGNSGCCDCGDKEAWRRDVPCTIHSVDAIPEQQRSQHQSGKEKAPIGDHGTDLPADLVESIRMTIARVIDYMSDVFSCSPEQLRLPKTEAGIQHDESVSRLSAVYGEEMVEDNAEYALVLWNDEKHTVDDVQNQVARACSQTKRFGLQKAMEVDSVGRSVIEYSKDLRDLLQKAEIIEQLKVTVTIRSSRDTFREQMCETIVDWIADISGCSVGNDSSILRNIVCEELLKPWRTGSQAINKNIGQTGIDDHEDEENIRTQRQFRSFLRPWRPAAAPNVVRLDIEVDAANTNDDESHDGDDDEEDDEGTEYFMEMDGDEMEIEIDSIQPMTNAAMAPDTEMDIDFLDENEDVTEALEATLAGYPPPPPPPNPGQRRRIFTPTESDDGETEPARPASNAPFENVPQTPKVKSTGKKILKPSRHWLEKPEAFRGPRPSEPCEDLWQRVRLDFLILYDLRLWKTLRIHLRHLYITTVVTIPHFKRTLGLRFAGLYTALAQLYLIADREPDHSIINLSVQMLTTPTITQEVVERGNFLANLMAILYTFLTTRQVGFPEDASPKATLAFDAGAVTNRRMFHFLVDLRWLLQSDFVLSQMRTEQRYLLQFLDLVKLHQGVCPNLRATGEHVEYESDAWIGASLIVKEINKLCKQVASSFEPKGEASDQIAHLHRALRTVAQVTMINCFGYERRRFYAAEIKDDLAWHTIGPFEESARTYSVPKHIVQTEHMSFHHPLHYLLSWLIENAKTMGREEMRSLLHFSSDDLKDPWNVNRSQSAPSSLTFDELLSAVFDHPLRVCVWLAQMKAGMWVRNGITLRHQAHTYRNISQRDVGYQRDLLMIQAGLVLCGSDTERPGERFLAQMIDRFQMVEWFRDDYSVVPGFDEGQQLDVIEDFFHLLVVALSERGNLIPSSDSKEQHDKVLQHDIAHALCFKPLSFSDLANRVTEKVSESDDFNRVLESMTTYRAPEGLNDTGTFDLKSEYIDLIDPYYAHYSRNHREEAETVYRKHVAHKTGKKAEDIVYEPNLQPVPSGLFANLAAFTSTPLFAQVVGTALNFAACTRTRQTDIQVTRIETFLHIVLHLAMIATMEDSDREGGFVQLASAPRSSSIFNFQQSIISSLVKLSAMEEYASCQPTIKHILRMMQYLQPERVSNIIGPLGAFLDGTDTGSPASLSAEEKERKKQEAMARQARVMAQMKQQQNSFLQNQGLSGFGDDLDDLDDMSISEEPENIEFRKTWNFPTGTCIWCQEETDDQRLYGTFAFLGESSILRTTPVHDVDFVNEVMGAPESLDRSADALRPFGVAGSNRQVLQKVGANGEVILSERQGLSKGFPQSDNAIKGPVSTTCGHIMHYSCFDLYLQNSSRRHTQQIARNHPENPELKEFTCPLCKALGNAFLPIIWKAKECAHEHELHAAKGFGDWLQDIDNKYLTQPLTQIAAQTSLSSLHWESQPSELSERSLRYVNNMFAPSLVASMHDLSLNSPTPAPSPHRRFSLRRGLSLSSLFGRSNSNQGSADVPVLSSNDEQVPRMTELIKAYQRIDQTISINHLSAPGSIDGGSINTVQPLSRALGLSISSFEIAHRGVSSNSQALSLLCDLPEQALTHFRTLSETIESYLAVSVLNQSPISPVSPDIVKARDGLTSQLFGMQKQAAAFTTSMDDSSNVLFKEDIFLFFVDWLTLMAPNVAEASSVLQLCYWAEVIKTVLVYTPMLQQSGVNETLVLTTPQIQVSNEFKLAVNIAKEDSRDLEAGPALSDHQFAILRRLVERYTLTFLRKCITAMYVKYGLDFECPYSIDPDTPEVERLTALLHIPSLEEMCALYDSQSEASDKLRSITRRWILHADASRDLQITLQHPSIFELIGLPKTYDTLTEEAIKRKCPTTGKEITDPALCLLCGVIFCSQAVCCMTQRNKGGCYRHTKSCSGKVGVFINIRKCMVLFTHGPGNGSFVHAPYLDRHGETDPTLRRHQQLFLNQKRYDKLIRDVWLQHQIPMVISRKLEAEINPGGWETL